MNAIYNSNSDIPQDMLLGNLLFVNLADMTVQASALKNIFKAYGIPESYVRDISQADAFRRASSSIKNRSIAVNGNNVRVEIDEVRCDSDSIKRIIGIKEIDSAAEDISYSPVGEILFERTSGTCIANPYSNISSNAFNEVSNLCREVSDKYNEWSVYHNKDTVRNIINRIIADTHPVNLMPTGLCKFSPIGSGQLLHALKDALKEMNQFVTDPANRENIMELIPVINTGDQRKLVEKNFKAEVSDELLGMVTELKDVLQKKQKISSRSAAAYIDKYKLYEAKIRDYESLLNIYVGSIRTQLGEVLQLIDDGSNGRNAADV